MINVYPFNSDEVVLAKDNKAVTENQEGAFQGFIMFEKDQVSSDLYGMDYINAHTFKSIWGHIDYFSPVCDPPEMTRAVNGNYTKELQNLHRTEALTPEEYVKKRVEVHERFLEQLNTMGFTHVIYGFTYGDSGLPEEIMTKCEQLEEEILNLD